MRLDPARLAGGIEHDLVADLDRAGLDGAGDDAAVVALLGELVDVLHRHPERLVDRRARSARKRSSASSTVGPWYQGIAAERLRDVVAVAAGHRDERRRAARRSGPGTRVYSADDARRSAPGRSPTRSILLTSTASCRMPSMDIM